MFTVTPRRAETLEESSSRRELFCLGFVVSKAVTGDEVWGEEEREAYCSRS